MAEIALIHILKMLCIIVRLQMSSIQMPQQSETLIEAAVSETESFMEEYINYRSQTAIVPVKMPNKTIH